MLLLLADFLVEWVGQHGIELVRVVGLTHTVVDHHLALVAADDETFREGHDLLDAEAFAWVVIQRPPYLAIVFAKDDLALVCAHQDLAFRKPAVSSVVL